MTAPCLVRALRRSAALLTMSSTPEVIRLANVSDVEAIESLVERAYRPWVEPIGQTPRPMLADYRSLVTREVVHVFLAGGRLVGVIVMWPQDDHFYVDNVAVDPSSQGVGLGIRLLDYADRSAAAAGYREIRLCTNELMVKNLSYYPRRGYVETHRSAEPGFRRVHFRKLLPPS